MEYCRFNGVYFENRHTYFLNHIHEHSYSCLQEQLFFHVFKEKCFLLYLQSLLKGTVDF